MKIQSLPPQTFEAVYTKEFAEEQKNRYLGAVEAYKQHFGGIDGEMDRTAWYSDGQHVHQLLGYAR